MFKLPSPGFLIEAALQAIRRFPFAILAALFGVTALFVLTENSREEDNWIRIWLVSMLGLGVFPGVAAWAESNQWPLLKKQLLNLAVLVALVVYWYFMDINAPGMEYRTLSEYVTLLLAVHLWTAVAPYLNREPVRDFWEYNKRLLGNFALGAGFSMVLFVGLSLALLAIDQLFDVSMNDKVYVRLFITLAGLFNTTYFLYHFPPTYRYEVSGQHYHAVFKNLCKFILIPVVALYFVILYAYAGKILFTWTLPKGWVGSLVIGFSAAGIFTYLLNFYLPEQDNSIQARGFKRWFWWVLLPMVGLLFVAIGRRISDYGVTEKRYLVVQLGVWLLLCCLFFLFSKKDNIKFIPITLGLFALSWAFGPFSARAVSERSQFNRLVRILERNDRFENNRMKPSSKEMDEKEAREVEAVAHFFQSRGRMDKLETYLPQPIDSLPGASDLQFDQPGKLIRWLGIRYNAVTGTAHSSVFYVYGPSNPVAVDVRGMEQLLIIDISAGSDLPAPEEDGHYFKLNTSGDQLEWYKAREKSFIPLDTFDLRPYLSVWSKQTNDYESVMLKGDSAIVRLNGAQFELRIALKNATVSRDDDKLALDYLFGYALSKAKTK